VSIRQPNNLFDPRRFFLEPSSPKQRQYEALRAYFVEQRPSAEVARAFGYSPGSFQVMCHHFRHSTDAAFFVTSRGVTNEIYYMAQKAARFIGTNHIDNAARLCHSPSGAAMKTTLGVGASTCSYKDWYAADVVVFFGSPDAGARGRPPTAWSRAAGAATPGAPWPMPPGRGATRG